MMKLNTRQLRLYMMIELLTTSTSHSITKGNILETLRCSEPTLHRIIADLRKQYQLSLVCSRATPAANSVYKVTNWGALTKAKRSQIFWLLEEHRHNTTVSLARPKKKHNPKKAKTLSLTLDAIRKIEQASQARNMYPSDVIEALIQQYL